MLLYKKTPCDPVFFYVIIFTVATSKEKKNISQSPPTCTDDTHSESWFELLGEELIAMTVSSLLAKLTIAAPFKFSVWKRVIKVTTAAL